MVRRLVRQLRIAPVGLLVVLVLTLAGCGDCVGEAYVWEDVDCDGEADKYEPPIEGICVWWSEDIDSPPLSPEECAEGFVTDSGGEWEYFWFPGCGCDAIYFFINVPDGYQPTTHTAVNGCRAEFGLARESSCPELASLAPEEQVAQQHMRETLTKLTCCLVIPLTITVGTALAGRFWYGPGPRQEQDGTAHRSNDTR
jgi:hypothetical protein